MCFAACFSIQKHWHQNNNARKAHTQKRPTNLVVIYFSTMVESVVVWEFSLRRWSHIFRSVFIHSLKSSSIIVIYSNVSYSLVHCIVVCCATLLLLFIGRSVLFRIRCFYSIVSFLFRIWCFYNIEPLLLWILESNNCTYLAKYNSSLWSRFPRWTHNLMWQDYAIEYIN